jgi:hypothetical protein
MRLPLARVRRIEHHQQVLVNWLLPPDQSPLETTIGYEQASIEVTAEFALKEPDPYLAQLYRFAMDDMNDPTNQLSDRLAFDRTGSRLYEMLLARVGASPTWDGGPSVEEVRSMLIEELQHFQLVKKSIERLGGDPTLVSSSAETSAVASLGLVQVLGDPRVPLRHAAHAILIAELADNDGWTMLIDVATAMGHDSMAADFRAARVVEDEHLARVRGWLRQAAVAEASMDLDDEPR